MKLLKKIILAAIIINAVTILYVAVFYRVYYSGDVLQGWGEDAEYVSGNVNTEDRIDGIADEESINDMCEALYAAFLKYTGVSIPGYNELSNGGISSQHPMNGADDPDADNTPDEPKNKKNVRGEIISVGDAEKSQPQELKLYGKTMQLGEPSIVYPSNMVPAGKSGNVRVTVHNRNLLQWPYYRHERSGTVYTAGGVTYEANNDGSVTFTGTNTGIASSDSEYAITKDKQLWLPAGTYTLSTGVAEDKTKSWYLMAAMFNQSTDNAVYAYGGSKEFVVTEPGYVFIALRVLRGETVDNAAIYPQLEIGPVYTGYIKPATVQTLTAQTHDGLYGVPVFSGGNYVDENGQHWVCDEIDFARGKYVQRIGHITLDGTVAMRKETTSSGYQQFYISLKSLGLGSGPGTASPIMCNYLPYGASEYGCAFISDAGYFILRPNEEMQEMTAEELAAMQMERPTHAAYVLDVPVESELTAEEIAAYKRLRLNSPSAVVICNEFASGSMTYTVSADFYKNDEENSASSALLNGIDADKLKAYREESLECLATYLVYQAGSSCVIGTPQLDEDIPMFFPVYNISKGYENLFSEKNNFVFTDTAEYNGKEYPVLYGDCETFVSLVTKRINYTKSAYCYGFKNPNATEEELLPYAVERGAYNGKPYTFSYQNYYKHRVEITAYASEKMGNLLYPVCINNNGTPMWDESVYETMESGDVMYCGYTHYQGMRYKNIGHIMVFIKDLDDLNKYGKQYGVTFQTIVKDREVGNGRHGYIAEISDATINGADVIRIRSLEKIVEALSANSTCVYDVMYVQKPPANINSSEQMYDIAKDVMEYLRNDGIG